MSTQSHLGSHSSQRAPHWYPRVHGLAAGAAAAGELTPLLGLESHELPERLAQRQDERPRRQHEQP